MIPPTAGLTELDPEIHLDVVTGGPRPGSRGRRCRTPSASAATTAAWCFFPAARPSRARTAYGSPSREAQSRVVRADCRSGRTRLAKTLMARPPITITVAHMIVKSSNSDQFSR